MSGRTMACWMASAVLILAGSSLAQRQRDQRQPQQSQQQQQRQQQQQLNMHRMSKLIGATVENREGEVLGEIQNFAVNPNTGHVVYMIVQTERRQPDARQVAVPFRAGKFQKDDDARVVIDIAERRWRQVPVFDPTGWQVIGDPEWGETVFRHFGLEPNREELGVDAVRGEQQGQRAPGRGVTLVRATDLLRFDVNDRAGDRNLGDVEDVVVAAEQGRIAFVVVDFDDDVIDDLEDDLHALPWQALNFQQAENALTLNVAMRQLEEAPAFDDDEWPNFNDPRYGQRIYAYYGAEQDWVYGVERPQAGAAEDGRGWYANDRYNRMFEQQNIQTFDGRVERVETVAPMSAMSEGIRLIVRSDDDDEMLNVDLGPTWYMRRQQEQIQRGDEVTVTGSRVNIEGQPVIMATEVRVGNRVLQLRDRNGAPLWDAWHTTAVIDRSTDRPRERDDRN